MKLSDLIGKSLRGQKKSLSEGGTKKRPTGLLDTTTPEDRVKLEMQQLINAIDAALYPSRPDRRDLIAIYQKAETDPHVLSQCEIAKSKLVGEIFVVNKGDAEDKEKTALFKQPWFEEFIKACFEAHMWGYTLIEFGPVKNGSWSYAEVFPRRHVEPFSRQILVRPGDMVGIPYGDRPEALFLLEIGKPKDLGLLQVISREVIWKNFSRTDWSQASEKFGMPLLYVKTGTNDESELNRLESLCKNFGTNGYVITDIDDQVEILETAKSDIYKIYEMNARFCDEQISKCINGQTGTSDEKSFVGSAEVHERILDDLHMSRLRNVSNIVNFSLFPFLQYHGYDLEGCVFRFPALDIKPQETPAAPDQDPDPQIAVASLGEKKKRSLPLTLPGWVITMPEEK